MITSMSAVENCNRSTINTTEESPLEVLSRAATMVRQEYQQAELAGKSDESNQHKQTTKWKRDRRRLPEYSRKSDPKVPETLGVEPSSPEASVSNGSTSYCHFNDSNILGKQDTLKHSADIPLDMTVRQRGEPPSYAQTMNNRSFRSNFRSDVASIVNNRDELPSGISMCDPVIEEHFRRSLGQDYHTIFQNNSSSKTKENPPETSSEVTQNLDSNESSSQLTDQHSDSTQSLEFNHSSSSQPIRNKRSNPNMSQEATTSRKKQVSFQNKQEKLVDTAQKVLTSSSDDWQVIGQSIGLQLKELNKYQLIFVQKIISEAIYYGKLEKLTEHSSINLGNPPAPFTTRYMANN